MPLVSGATAAGFHIVRLLGRGQIGELYVAEHPSLPRPYALKILSADVSTDPEYRYRFKQESDRAATLWHPNIVSLHDRGEFQDRLWLSMDYVDGTDAAQLLTDTYPDGMPSDMVIEIVSAIADALDYAHEQGLVHRYVNPSNILLSNVESPRRRILLAGFGVARRPDEINSLTRANLGIGTVSYAAPEQLIDDSIDGRTDQYALAGTAFHLLTGSPLFQHMNPAVVISKHLNERPPRPSDVIPELIFFDAPFARALMKSPNERFQRCRDFAKALEARGSLKLSIRSPGAATLLTAPKTNGAAPTEPPVPPPPAAAVPAPPAAEVGDSVAPPDALAETDVDDAVTFAEPDVWRAATDDTSVASRRPRRLHTAGLVLTIMAVALGGILGVMALRSASQSDDTPPNVETPSSVTTVPPARPAPATAIPPPMVTAPAPVTTTSPPAAPSPAATTTPPPSSPPPETTVPPTTPTPPAGPDTRPAIGMPCGSAGATAVATSGGPVNCVETPGGFAWEPPGG
jgi:serine/threonine protein kinase, bacterial